MRNLKRALSLALALVMVVSMMVVGAGAVSIDDFTDSEEIVNTEAVTVLATLGVITGNDDGTYAPADTISRAEMATIICRVLNGGSDPVLGETVADSYTDTTSHWAKAYIEYCTTLGIVSGKGDGTYDPEGEVTVSEAAKMVLVALGYSASLEGYTGGSWQINVDARANPLGLYDDLSYSTTSAALTRDNAAQMLYNALDCDIVRYDVVFDTTSSTLSSTTQLTETDETLLENRFDAVKVEGIVVANEIATLDSSSSGGSHLVAGRTRILVTNYDDQEYYGGAENSDGYYDETEDFTVSTGLDELGRSVSIYVKKEPTSTNAQVLGSVIVSENNVVVTSYGRDSLATIADDNGLDVMEAAHAGEDYYDDGTLIAYNYGGLDELAASDADDNSIRGQEKILIDNDDDGDVEYILVNSWRFGKVTSYVSSGDGSIVINQGSAATLSKSDADDVIGFEDVARDDYVIAAEIGGRIHVSLADTVTGNLDAYNTGACLLEDTTEGTHVTRLTVDGEDYSVSSMDGYTGGADDIKAAYTYDETYLDNEATFYLGAGGFVVAVGETDASAYSYALVLATGSTGLEDRVRVALADGTIGTYNIDDDSDVDEDTAKVGTVYRYSTNSSGEIRLTEVAARDTTTLTNASFQSGRTSIRNTVGTKTSTVANATSSTVFFYVGVTDIDPEGSIDRNVVDIYTGYGNAPDLDSDSTIQGAVYIRSSNDSTNSAGAVVFYGDADLTSADMDSSLYVTDILRRNNNYIEVEAFVAGSAELQTINIDANSRDILAAGNAYTYTVNSDNYYELTRLTVGEDGVNGDAEVTSASSNTFVLSEEDFQEENEYEITAETLFVNDSDYLDDPTAELGAGPSEGSLVTWALYNSEHEAVLVVIQDAEGTSGLASMPTVTFNKTGSGTLTSTGTYSYEWTGAADNDTLTITVTQPSGTTQDLAVSVSKSDDIGTVSTAAALDPAEGVSVSGETVYTAGPLENGGVVTVTVTAAEAGRTTRTLTYRITVSNVSAEPTASAVTAMTDSNTSTTVTGSGNTWDVAGADATDVIGLNLTFTGSAEVTDYSVTGTLDPDQVSQAYFASGSPAAVYTVGSTGEAGTLTLTVTTTESGKAPVDTQYVITIGSVTTYQVRIPGQAVQTVASGTALNTLTGVTSGTYVLDSEGNYLEVDTATVTGDLTIVDVDLIQIPDYTTAITSISGAPGTNGGTLAISAQSDVEYAKQGDTITVTVSITGAVVDNTSTPGTNGGTLTIGGVTPDTDSTTVADGADGVVKTSDTVLTLTAPVTDHDATVTFTYTLGSSYTPLTFTYADAV